MVGKAIGRAIQHISLSDEELKAGMVQAGMSEDYADMLPYWIKRYLKTEVKIE
ncbi:hypothetical protein GMA19_02252 [Paenibacillus polymyxa E681]|uniref:hypothetical protein n=1 Tax=Paenibacillus polymyxa TaxID=1406 RepID=UPI0002F2C5FB|nr:hypothetical protein [Paenibacillus polymyxa]AJW69224.1 hypothetical protein PPE_05745 [Paenibacillus polymyxa E681]QNV57085.1 hypothetical protein GE561_02252 [Paenibacillus polymyxa E681]QNV61922.1 hypothetical protein GMA19_02252 [Paenibacillus polymyxa E681]